MLFRSSYNFQVSDFFTRLIQRVAPKSYKQALGEVYVTQKFFENFSGDQVHQDEITLSLFGVAKKNGLLSY